MKKSIPWGVYNFFRKNLNLKLPARNELKSIHEEPYLSEIQYLQQTLQDSPSMSTYFQRIKYSMYAAGSLST